MRSHPQPDPRLMERLTRRIRSRDGAVASWIAGGEALALAVLSNPQDLPIWASDLADTMVGSLLRVLDRSVDEATADERAGLALAAVVLSVTHPHCTSVLDGAVDAWTADDEVLSRNIVGEDTLATWVVVLLLRDRVEVARDTAETLCERDGSGIGAVLHDWVVARAQGHGSSREFQLFHAVRAALLAQRGAMHRPGLVIAAAAAATRGAGQKRRSTGPWLDQIWRDMEQDGTSSAYPLAALNH